MYYDMMSCFGVERLSDVGVGNLDLISKTFISKDHEWNQGIVLSINVAISISQSTSNSCEREF